MEKEVSLKELADQMKMTVEQLEQFIEDTPNRHKRIMQAHLNNPEVKEHMRQQLKQIVQRKLDKQKQNE